MIGRGLTSRRRVRPGIFHVGDHPRDDRARSDVAAAGSSPHHARRDQAQEVGSPSDPPSEPFARAPPRLRAAERGGRPGHRSRPGGPARRPRPRAEPPATCTPWTRRRRPGFRFPIRFGRRSATRSSRGSIGRRAPPSAGWCTGLAFGTSAPGRPSSWPRVSAACPAWPAASGRGTGGGRGGRSDHCRIGSGVLRDGPEPGADRPAARGRGRPRAGGAGRGRATTRRRRLPARRSS